MFNTRVSYIVGKFFTIWTMREAQIKAKRIQMKVYVENYSWIAISFFVVKKKKKEQKQKQKMWHR